MLGSGTSVASEPATSLMNSTVESASSILDIESASTSSQAAAKPGVASLVNLFGSEDDSDLSSIDTDSSLSSSVDNHSSSDEDSDDDDQPRRKRRVGRGGGSREQAVRKRRAAVYDLPVLFDHWDEPGVEFPPHMLAKQWLAQGMYSRSEAVSSDYSPARTRPRKSLASFSRPTVSRSTGPYLPLPLHFGAELLSSGGLKQGWKDFDLPFDISWEHEKGLHESGRRVAIEFRDEFGNIPKPAKFISLKHNVFPNRKPDLCMVISCHCNPAPARVQRECCGENCLNRLMQYLCHPKSCPTGSNCTNGPLHQRAQADIEVFYTGKRGHGIRSKAAIAKGAFVIDYRGEVVTIEDYYDRVEGIYADRHDYYALEYGENEIIDAGMKGNIARFVNHSCDPNLEVRKYTTVGKGEEEYEVGFFAKRNIVPGEELSYNYNFDNFSTKSVSKAAKDLAAPKKCLCGAKRCKGWLGKANSTDITTALLSSKELGSANAKLLLQDTSGRVLSTKKGKGKAAINELTSRPSVARKKNAIQIEAEDDGFDDEDEDELESEENEEDDEQGEEGAHSPPRQASQTRYRNTKNIESEPFEVNEQVVEGKEEDSAPILASLPRKPVDRLRSSIPPVISSAFSVDKDSRLAQSIHFGTKQEERLQPQDDPNWNKQIEKEEDEVEDVVTPKKSRQFAVLGDTSVVPDDLEVTALGDISLVTKQPTPFVAAVLNVVMQRDDEQSVTEVGMEKASFVKKRSRTKADEENVEDLGKRSRRKSLKVMLSG